MDNASERESNCTGTGYSCSEVRRVAERDRRFDGEGCGGGEFASGEAENQRGRATIIYIPPAAPSRTFWTA